MDFVGHAAPPVTHPDVATAVHVVSLAEGLYSLAVRPSASPVNPSADIALPALHISEAPTSNAVSGRLDLLAAPNLIGNWLTQPGDAIVARISGGVCQILITSLTRSGVTPLSIEVRRLDQRTTIESPAVAPSPTPPLPTNAILDGSNIQAPNAAVSDDGRIVLRSAVAVHIQNRGDLRHEGEGWAGAFDERLPIEAFALAVDGDFPSDGLDYRGLTANGFETPWLSKGAWCGTRGMGIPLQGITIRLKPALAVRYLCEYSAAFLSGGISETVTDGVQCRSTEPDDPVIAIKFRLVERDGAPENLRPTEQLKSKKRADSRIVGTYR